MWKQKRTSARILSTIVAITGLFINTSAQQDPSRQLTQTESTNTTSSKRIALVIGNGNYTSAPQLKNPPNDAREMSATLRTLGFDVTSGINVNQRDMKRLIREFGMKLKGGGSGLFFYAGHGVQSKGRNYLIPVDANIQSEAEVEDSGVDAALVMNFMDDAQNGLNIVILDACRNNPFARSFRSASDGLAQVDAPTGTLIAYATAPGRVASDGNGQNGLYTAELLKQMHVPGISITDMFMRVRAEVMRQTGSKQVPWESSSLVGSFYFSGGASSLPTTSEVRVDASAFELSYWETIKSSQSADDYKAYLEKYPEGQFANLAKTRIAALQPVTKPAEPPPANVNAGQAELTFWDSVKNSTSADDYRAYLEKYPNGEFVVLAKRRLKPLEATEEEKVKGEEIARNIVGTWESQVMKDNYLHLMMMAGGTCRLDDRLECTWAFADTNHRAIKFKWNTGTGSDFVMMLSADGQRLEGTDSRGMPVTYSRIGGSPNSTANNSATDPNAKIFSGYMGVMSAGFTARPGKLVIGAAGMEFIWDRGTQGIAEGRTDGLTGSKAVSYSLHPDPLPTSLQCTYFTAARNDGFFIREINFNDPAALVKAIGWGGAVVRFRASSPAEAISALAAVRDFCNKRP